MEGAPVRLLRPRTRPMQTGTEQHPGRAPAQTAARSARRQPERVADCMSTTVRTLPAQATLRDVACRLAAFRIGCVVVVEDGRAVGIITERDIVRLAAAEPEAWATMLAGTVMLRPEEVVLLARTGSVALRPSGVVEARLRCDTT